ncbi:MAG: TonB-dependent receptor [Panacagrimonas sp.]
MSYGQDANVPEIALVATTSSPAVSSTRLPEILVTAQRTEQLIEDVPISVSLIDGELLRASAARDLADAAPYLPSVRVDANDPGLPQLYIRGFGTNPFNPSFEGAVGFVQDDVAFGRTGYFNEALYDVAQIEVLRGPQGTLFGKNASAGLFNVMTRQPNKDWSGDLLLSHGDPHSVRVVGGTGGELADWARLRISGLYREEDGELFNTQLARDEEKLRQRGGRVQLLLTPDSPVQTRLLAQTSNTRAAYWPFQLMQLDTDTRSYLQSFDAQVEDNALDFQTSMNTPGFIERGSTTLSLNTQWPMQDVLGLNALTPVLVLAHSKFHIGQLDDLDVSPADIARLNSREDHRQRSAELRLSAAADQLFGVGQGVQFVFGAYAYEARYDFGAKVRVGEDFSSYALTPDLLQLASGNASLGLPGGVGLPGFALLGPLGGVVIGEDFFAFDYAQDTRSQALFGNLSLSLTEHWMLSAGLRLNQERKHADVAGGGSCPGKQQGLKRPCVFQTLVSGQDYALRDLRRRESDVSPRLALQYFLAEAQLYASYAQGYKSGGYNAISFSGEDVDFSEETARALELGLKGQALNARLRYALAVHHTRFQDLQVLAFNGVFFDVTNAASASSEGLEMELQWATPWPWLSLSGSLGLLDARYDDYRDAPAPVAQGIGARQDLSGRRIAFAPRSTAALTPSVDIPWRTLRLGAALDLLHQGMQFTDTDLDPATRVAAHSRIDARASLAAADAAWSLSLGASNLTDRRVLNQVVDSAFFPGTFNAIQARGRQVFVTLRARF